MAVNPPDPHSRRDPGVWSKIKDHVQDMAPLEQALWAVVIIVLVVAGVVLSTITSDGNRQRPRTTPVGQVSTPTRSPSFTPIPSVTPSPRPSPFPTLEPLNVPTPPPGGMVLALSPNPDRTGWVGSNEPAIHWRDRNLHAGTYQGQALLSIVQFDVKALAPGTKILFAALELTGLDAKSLGQSGEWKVDLINSEIPDGAGATYSSLRSAATLAQLGTPFQARGLAARQTSRVVVEQDQLALLQKQLDYGAVTVRLTGPADGADDQFTWDGGPGAGEPTLYLVVMPASFAVLTSTPTPVDLFEAATVVARQTGQARQYGTPTSLPRSVVTATPGAIGRVVVTSVPTPANLATATAQSLYATAVAATTGTFTPTPRNWITATPTPQFIALGQFTPVPTPLPRPTEVSLLEYRKTPIPNESGLIGKIAFTTDRDGGQPQVWIMEPDGNPVGKLTGTDDYRIAQVHDLYSPDWSAHLDFQKDFRDKWTIVVYDIAKGIFSPMIDEERGATGMGVYDPAWSPDGSKIAFVSNASINSEIWLFDVKTKNRKRLTWTLPDPLTMVQADNKHPSWSPDGTQIVFSSNRDNVNRWQIWIMNPDGGGIRNLSPSPFNDTNPVWIKR